MNQGLENMPCGEWLKRLTLDCIVKKGLEITCSGV